MYAFTKMLLASSLIAVAPALVIAQTGSNENGENGTMVAKVEKRVLTLAGARMVAAAAESEARRLNTTGAVAVVDDGGNLLYLLRIDNTFPAGSYVAMDKARTAATFRMPTRNLEDAVKNGRVSLVAVSEMTPLAGGVPIVIDGQVVGAVGVSGAANAQQDEELAKFAAAAIK